MSAAVAYRHVVPRSRLAIRYARAFSTEGDTGSREETRQNKKLLERWTASGHLLEIETRLTLNEKVGTTSGSRFRKRQLWPLSSRAPGGPRHTDPSVQGTGARPNKTK